MREAFLTFLILLGPAAFLFLIILSVAFIFMKAMEALGSKPTSVTARRFSMLWQLCFYLCSLSLVALMAVLPLTYRPCGINDEFPNNAIMFLPLTAACIVLAFAAFKKPRRYFVLIAVILGTAAFVFYVSSLNSRRPAPLKAAMRIGSDASRMVQGKADSPRRTGARNDTSLGRAVSAGTSLS